MSSKNEFINFFLFKIFQISKWNLVGIIQDNDSYTISTAILYFKMKKLRWKHCADQHRYAVEG